MRKTDLPAYTRIKEKFETEEFHTGTKSTLPIYSYEKGMTKNLTPGHYVNAIGYSKIHFCDIPQKYRTRDFFLNALSGVHKDIVAYVKEHLGTEFDRNFFKDHIATDRYALDFEENCFEYMPLDYIDEEMISCAMLSVVNDCYAGRRGDHDAWFYSVAKRKPEVLTQDFWTLGARLFARRGTNGKNNFLAMTPEQFRTEEYYFAMCLGNDTPVMEDFPKEILSTNFLVLLINSGVNNIASFSAEALERKVPMKGQSEEVKIWQAALLLDGYQARNIPLNDERVAFFLNHYDKDSGEYCYGFKDAYKRYLKTKENTSHKTPEIDDSKKMALLPIKYDNCVPEEFRKVYDREEYLCEIYKKLGIEIVREFDSHYYRVVLPQNLRVECQDSNYYLINGNNIVLKFCDVGPFWDRSVYVYQINCSL